MTVDVSRYLDPDEMIADNQGYSVTGVTQEYPCFVPASQLVTCEWCGNRGVHPAEIEAVKPENHAVMMCNKCMPEPPEEWK